MWLATNIDAPLRTAVICRPSPLRAHISHRWPMAQPFLLECSFDSIILTLETSRVYSRPELSLLVPTFPYSHRRVTIVHCLQTFDGRGDTFGCAEGVDFWEGPFSSFTRCLDSEGVASEFHQSLDFVGMAGSPVDWNKPREGRTIH